MLGEALSLLLEMVVQPFVAILLLRFHLQWLHAPMRNPIGEFAMVLTDFVVLPLRKRIPPVAGLDSATLLLALLVEAMYLICIAWINGIGFIGVMMPGLFALAIIKLFKISIYILMAALVVQAILSFVNQHSPLAPVLHAITQRFLQPLRRVIPLVGQFDLAPLALLIICQLILLPIAHMEHIAMRLF